MSAHPRLRGEAERARLLVERGERRFAARDPFWPAQLAALAAIALYVALPQQLTAGPKGLLPALEGVLALALIVAMPNPAMRYSPWRRRFAIALIGLVSAANLASLALLIHYLLGGGNVGGEQLVMSGVVLWATNVLIFGLWFWELDRGGPIARAMNPAAQPDFLFPQMTEPRFAPPGWMPGFVDYLYLSLTNATAFSPTDTLPLSRSAKALMGVQSLAALVTLGLVVARAVNVLG